jgi:peptide/nickel transport system substrate-binding protein
LPPFDDVRVRRAVNFAVDRAEVVRLYGGSSIATPMCQPLAPGISGYRRYCPYTRSPRADGRWTAPDIRRARALVAASGTTGARIEMLGVNDSVGVPRELSHYIAAVLRSLGYRVHVRDLPQDELTPSLRRHANLTTDGDWLPDYPDPSSYFAQFFACNGAYDNRSFCDHALDTQMRRASLLELQDPLRATRLWTQIDHRIADEAAWVPLVNLQSVDIVSKRLRNYQFNPVWGFIADQAWVD